MIEVENTQTNDNRHCNQCTHYKMKDGTMSCEKWNCEFEQQSLPQHLQTIADIFCSDYCKIPEQYTEEEWEEMDYAPCEGCPMSWLI